MEYISINLNIHYSTPKAIWDEIVKLYTQMPYWQGYVKGIPHWYSINSDTDGKLIWASVEPGGLQFYAQLPQVEWDEWITSFKNKATELLGYEVGEPEDGYEFFYYD